MTTFTTKQQAVIDAMISLKEPASITRIMTHTKGVDSKAQVKTLLQQLIDLGTIKRHSNGVFAIITKASRNRSNDRYSAPAAKATKPTDVRQDVIDKMAAHTKEFADARKEIDKLTNQLTTSQADCTKYLSSLEKIREAAGYPVMLHSDISRNIERDKKERDQLKTQLEAAREQLEAEKQINNNFDDCISQIRTEAGYPIMMPGDLAKAIAADKEELEKLRKHPAPETPAVITPRQALEAVSEMISGIFSDEHTRVIVYREDAPEIICNGTRYEIPVGSDKETTAFIESLSFVSGQAIDSEAA